MPSESSPGLQFYRFPAHLDVECSAWPTLEVFLLRASIRLRRRWLFGPLWSVRRVVHTYSFPRRCTGILLRVGLVAKNRWQVQRREFLFSGKVIRTKAAVSSYCKSCPVHWSYPLTTDFRIDGKTVKLHAGRIFTTACAASSNAVVVPTHSVKKPRFSDQNRAKGFPSVRTSVPQQDALQKAFLFDHTESCHAWLRWRLAGTHGGVLPRWRLAKTQFVRCFAFSVFVSKSGSPALLE